MPTSIAGWLAIISLGLISQGMEKGLLTYSLARYRSGFVAVFMLTILAIAAVLALIIFDEQLSLSNCLALAAMWCGIYWAISAKKDSESIL